MKQYGYIDEGLEDAEALYTETGLKNVIKEVQKYGAIPQTGLLDETTIQVLPIYSLMLFITVFFLN